MNGINTNISTQGGKLTDEVALSRIAMYEVTLKDSYYLLNHLPCN